ncbi:MAG TPA: hypothetical protein VFQ35_13645 [Polyangiaceae bacterium]|nr:hypothetical protein [Polyangiaceae bacterium]
MAVVRRDGREPGLPSLNEARVERRRAFVMGKVRMPAVPMHFWLWAAVLLSASGVVYWRLAEGKLETERSKIMAKQRAMSKALGPRLFPFREKSEGWVRELAAPWTGPLVSPSADLEKVRNAGTIYLRLRMANAKGERDMRKAAKDSLRDGFTSCLFVTRSSSGTNSTVAASAAPAASVAPAAMGAAAAGAACRTIGDCASGLLCNEWNTCAPPEQPYNMRLVYRTLRVLSSDWTDELHEASSELALSAYDRDLENVARRDVPVTVEILARSKFFALVLDEDPPGGIPKPAPESGESDAETLQRLPHFARIGIWDIASGTPLLRVRAVAAGEVVQMGGGAAKDAVTRTATERQVNSCALALKAREALEQHTVADDAALP